ncbi:GNAT family N-acetyltransferase [Streptomyces fuscigenes]|uniref:GNAT family N-acetyltransferase n=1 Tax=Streptomyces fuscigenes TaxID=1528880 RepID=UPI001F4167DE|nr:GNAT family N-acetyltransferase [Streptomyces fuscigenes]MCF3964454.1 GNAT family N-acetyltransferase [Streptomyces fuscigenes]
MDSAVQNFAVAHLRRRALVVETGGFVAGFEPDTDSLYINYATPLPGARPGAADVRALVGEFRSRGLKPRLEFAPEAAPAVEPALLEAGFTLEEEHVYLVCTTGTLTAPAPGGPEAATPHTDEDYAALDAALCDAFEGRFASSPEGVARLRRTQERGGAVRLVRAPDGSCAGGGGCSAPAAGTSELAGIGTRPQHRGRGVAAAVVHSLTEAMFAAGAGSAWLEYSGDGSRRVYERLGYRPAGRRLYMSIP